MLLDFSAKKARKGTAFIWNTQIFLQKKCRNVKFLHFFVVRTKYCTYFGGGPIAFQRVLRRTFCAIQYLHTKIKMILF